MKKLMSIVFAGLAILLLAAGCNKYDDSELRGKISSLESRVAELESLKTTVSGIQTSVSNLQKNLFVTSVKQEAGSVTLLFSDGSSAVISNGKDGATPQIGIKLDGGVYYWTINGEVVKDAAGKPIPVAGENAPQFRVNAGGDLEYSVDGTTWKPVAAAGIDIQVSQTETTVTVTFADGSSITLPKEVPFYLAIESNSALVLSAGESVELPYTVYGAFADDEVEVDLVSVATGLEAAVTPKTGTSGTVTVKCNTTVAGSYKVVVYATNHTGKSDIVSLTFTVGEGGGEETPDDYAALTGLYTFEGTGKYNYYDSASKKWTVKNGKVSYNGFISPAEDSEEYYVAGLYEEYEGQTYVSCYMIIGRDAATGALDMIVEKTDEWTHETYGAITDWQCAYIEYQGSLYYVTGSYTIGTADAPKNGVITFQAGPQLDISGFSDPFDILGVEFLGMYSEDKSLFYADIPFPATFTKTAELPASTAASIKAQLPKKLSVGKKLPSAIPGLQAVNAK